MKKISLSLSKYFSETFKNNVISFLKQNFDVVIDDENPQYLIASVNVFATNEEAVWLLEHDEAIKILFTGEAVCPDFNLFDYAICYDDGLVFDDRVLRIPVIEFDKVVDNFVYENFDEKVYRKKDKFCNFIYSNAMAHPNRDKFFHLLSEYKKVDSAGMHLRNMEWDFTNKTYGFMNNWRENLISLKSLYKFSIAFENATYKGYTTEKLLTSMQAGTIPIYWGNPNVGRDFNTKSFINCHNYDSFEEVVEKVKQLDSDDVAYQEMYAQPWRTAEQIARSEQETRDFYEKFRQIFAQDIACARRHHQGCRQEMYKETLRQRISDKEIVGNNEVRKRRAMGGLLKATDTGDKLKLSVCGIKLTLK